MIGDARETYSDNTLMTMTKKELISVIRCLEGNLKSANETLDQHIKNTAKLLNDSHEEVFKAVEDIIAEAKNTSEPMMIFGGRFDGIDLCDIASHFVKLARKKVVKYR